MRARILLPALVFATAALGGLRYSIAEAGVSGIAGVTLAQAPAERAAGVSPVLDPISDMTVDAGQTADQALHATDADNEPLSFFKTSGQSYMSVTTTDPGAGSATGNIHLAPDSSESGTTTGAVGVTDGQLVTQRSFLITIVGGNAAPVLVQPDPMNLRVGEVADQELSATDANGDPLSFSRVAGPPSMTVTTTDPGSGVAYGNVHIPASASDVGTWTGAVSVSDGFLTDQKSFGITVVANRAPYLYPLYSMLVRAGEIADQSLTAYDGDGDYLEFSKVSGPAYMTVTTTTAGPTYAYGNLRLAPTPSDVGSTSGTVRVSDGALSDQKSLGITVTTPDRAPVLSQPANMTATVGEVAEQTITATDPDGDYMYLSKASGPSYMTVSGYGYGSLTGTIRLAPGINDVGVATGSVMVTSNSLTDTKSFSITIQAGDFPPPCGADAFTQLVTFFGYGLIEVQTADLNGDGVLDLLVELPEDGRAATALGNGDGSFGPPVDLDAGIAPVSGVIADYNRDQIPDLAILDYQSGNVGVFLGDGTGGFGTRRVFSVGGARSIAAADVNRDGKLDLLTANPYSNSVSILRGNGDGTFQTALSLAAGNAAWHLDTPDLNRDGAPDLVVVNAQDHDISVFRNNGSGVFGSRVDYPAGQFPLIVASGDLNEDGAIDLVVSNSGSSSVTVYPGDGDGTLGTKRTFATHFGPRQIAVTDLNGDGHLDLATANLDSNDASILLGNGTGAFGPHSDIQTGSGPYGMATGDFDDDLRPDLAVANYYGGSVTILLNGCAPARDHPPVVKAPSKVSGGEGSPVAFTITANDPDGPSITSLSADTGALPVGHNAVLTSDATKTGGTFRWTPTYQDARPLPYEVTFTAANVLSGSATTKITVLNVNRAPVANAGGPYSAFAGSPVMFDGTGSGDPDGDELSYLWVYGDGGTGVGANPVHTYTSLGVYGVALTVSDGALSNLATTTASVVGIFEARAFTSSGNRSIRLSSGKPQWCANVEPVGRSYSNVAVDLTSIVMKSPGTGAVGEIRAIAGKTSVGGDHDGNGVEEITACFSKSDLRLLFSDLRGNTTVTVTIEGHLFAGGIFRAQMDVGVLAGGGALAASLSPNPLNPEGVLTFVTEKPGFARVNVFDLHGRLVRRLMNESLLPVGYHDLRVDARDEGGAPLASGVYFYRIDAVEGVETGRFTILK